MSRTFESRICRHPNGCWLWIGYVRKNDGYGEFSKRLAHRIAYERANGPIPGGLFVCHACDNPLCVNPGHLFLGTQHDNLVDMSLKGRGRGQGQTHCVNGHEFSPANTYWRPGKIASRDCRTCIRDRVRRYKLRRAA